MWVMNKVGDLKQPGNKAGKQKRLQSRGAKKILFLMGFYQFLFASHSKKVIAKEERSRDL